MKNKNEVRNKKKEQLEVEKGSDNEIKSKLPAPRSQTQNFNPRRRTF